MDLFKFTNPTPFTSDGYGRVMLTSRGGEKHRQKATSLGVTDYMVKPFHEDALLRNIDRLVTAASRTPMKAAS